MAKIICDVCGTSYPETATQCPICGCVRSVRARTTSGGDAAPEAERSGTYTYVKGGRFSKANVEKRNRGIPVQTQEVSEPERGDETSKKNKDLGFIIAIIALLLAIFGVIAFIVIRYISPAEDTPASEPSTSDVTEEPTDESTEESTTESTEPTTESTVAPILCDDIIIDEAVVELTEVGQRAELVFTLSPADTTEVASFISEDETVATVSADGVVTAVAEGETLITVICGEATNEFRVVCVFVPEETEPEYDASKLKLEYYFTTIEDSNVGEATVSRGTSWALYNENKCKIPANVITFTSSNPNVATVDSTGKVEAVGSGTTYIKASYGGVEKECKIIVP